MSTGFVHFLQGADPLPSLRIQTAILRHGLGLRLHTEVDDLCTALAESAAPGVSQLALVAGEPALLFTAVEALRQANPLVQVLGLLNQVNEDVLRQALRSGVDACWPAGASPRHIAAQLQRRLRVSQEHAEHSSGLGPHSGWLLEAGGWALRSGAIRISLTSAERAFVLALYRAPGHALSHAEMASAIEQGTGRQALCGEQSSCTAADTAARRLSVLMSRLRRKFNAAGVEMPVYSLRGLGYALNTGAPATESLQAAGAVVPAIPFASGLP